MTAEKTITLPFPLIESRIFLVVGIVVADHGKEDGLVELFTAPNLAKTFPLLVGQILVKEVFE